MSLTLNFATRPGWLEDCFTLSAADLAKNVIYTDECNFARLSRGSLIENDDVVSEILAHWGALSNSVWEYCSGIPNMVPSLQHCALVSISTSEFIFSKREEINFAIASLDYFSFFFKKYIITG